MPHHDDQWHDAGPAGQLHPGAAIEAIVDGTVVAIANVDGVVHALDGVCAHQGGPLGKGRLEGCTLTCPWHGWQYDVTTGRQRLSQTIRQASFAARIQGDRIQVCFRPPPGRPAV